MYECYPQTCGKSPKVTLQKKGLSDTGVRRGPGRPKGSGKKKIEVQKGEVRRGRPRLHEYMAGGRKREERGIGASEDKRDNAQKRRRGAGDEEEQEGGQGGRTPGRKAGGKAAGKEDVGYPKQGLILPDKNPRVWSCLRMLD